jgi:hypothetical protein
LAVYGAFAALLAVPAATAQVVTIDTHGNATTGPNGAATVDRRFAQIQPTHIQLPKGSLDGRTKLQLIRDLEGEQGFAMRPFPMGHRGLTLVANGKLDPAGEGYLDMVTANGVSAKPGDALVITDMKFDRNKIIFSLNGGPDAKHRFLQHIQIGMGGGMTTPVVQNDAQNNPQGAHLTLDFKEHMPPVTAADIKALLTPLISFDVKTPIQAFTDTLPPALKSAILDHKVLVGMTTDMVMFALGQPDQRVREMDGQIPFEEWIYGKPPQPVEFVRINGNRVIRLEIAKVGEPPEIFTKDEVEGLMRADGTPVAPDTHTRTIAMGDTKPNTETQAPNAPPSLRKQGESLPQDDPHSNVGQGTMRPVEFPKQKPDDYPDASNLPRSSDEAAKPADSQKDKSKTADGQPNTPPAQGTQPAANPAPAQAPQPNQP